MPVPTPTVVDTRFAQLRVGDFYLVAADDGHKGESAFVGQFVKIEHDPYKTSEQTVMVFTTGVVTAKFGARLTVIPIPESLFWSYVADRTGGIPNFPVRMAPAPQEPPHVDQAENTTP